MTTASPVNIMDKIKALLAMAEHPNSNPNEASIAMERAQRLLLEHNLTRADVVIGGAPEPDQHIGQVDGHETTEYMWRVCILNEVAKANLCRVVINRPANAYHLFGTRTNTGAVLEMYRWIVSQLIEMGARDYTEYKRQGGYETARRYMAGWRNGTLASLHERLSKPYNEFASGAGRALIIYNDEAVAEAVKRVFPRLGRASGSRTYSDGTSAGRRAGNSVTLARQYQIASSLRLRPAS